MADDFTLDTDMILTGVGDVFQDADSMLLMFRDGTVASADRPKALLRMWTP